MRRENFNKNEKCAQSLFNEKARIACRELNGSSDTVKRANICGNANVWKLHFGTY